MPGTALQMGSSDPPVHLPPALTLVRDVQGWSRPAVIWTTPLFFGAAHLHHLVEMLGQGVSPAVAVLQALFTFAYTTLFGW